MKKILRFEDIEAWQQARVLTNCLYAATASGAWAKDFALRDQVRRAAISVLSNISEGFERGTDKEFKHFLSIAKGSASEIKGQLYIALDQKYIEPQLFDRLYQLTDKICALLGGFIRYLREPSNVKRRVTRGSLDEEVNR